MSGPGEQPPWDAPPDDEDDYEYEDYDPSAFDAELPPNQVPTARPPDADAPVVRAEERGLTGGDGPDAAPTRHAAATDDGNGAAGVPGASPADNPQVGEVESGCPELEDPDVADPEVADPDVGDPEVGDPEVAGTEVALGTDAGTGLRRATAVMAVGTTLSRATGVLRIFALTYALGTLSLADSYNLANTMPNIVHDIVLGGILSATFVPVFVQRLTTRADDEAWDAVSAVVSVTMIVIAAASLLFLLAVPFIIDATTSLNHGAQAVQSRALAKDLLFLFVPQLTCYGFISVGTALLNARRKFGAPMFTPIANNVVLIAILLVFGTTVRHASLAGVAAHKSQILLLGLGTTAGVVAQAGLMVPSLRRAGLKLHWRPDFRHEAVRTILRLSGWTVGLVVANQLALLVVLALSEKVGPGAVSAYTYAYIFFQLPYGVVAVSIMSAMAPELTARWAQGDLVAFRRRMGTGLRAMLAIVIPAAAGELILARPLVALVAGHGAAHSTTATAESLAMLALGLPGFCVFLYAVRVLQSVQDLRSAFWLYAFENGVNIVLAVALAGHFGVRGIALSISIAYTAAAIVALAYVRARFQGIAGDVLGRPLGHVLLATAALVVGAVLGSNFSGSETTVVLLGRVALGSVAGGGAYVLAGGGLAELGRRRRIAAREQARSDAAAAAGPDSGRPPPRGPGPRPGPRPPQGPPQSMRSRGSAPKAAPRRRSGAPPRPAPLPPAGRPPMRPGRLGPTRSPESGGSPHDDAGL